MPGASSAADSAGWATSSIAVPFDRGNEPLRVAGETREGLFQSITDWTHALRETGKALEDVLIPSPFAVIVRGHRIPPGWPDLPLGDQGQESGVEGAERRV
jgi:hypothetical protein